MLSRWLCFDIETTGRGDAAEFIGTPAADSRLKDPEKIKADLDNKRQSLIEKAGLDWNVSRIVAIGGCDDAQHEPHVVLCATEDEERDALSDFWITATNHHLVGFRCRLFDLPTMVQRSRYLGVKHPAWRELLARFGKGRVTDLYDELTFDDPYGVTSCAPRKLTTFCRQFGIDIPEDDGVGADIARLVKESAWEQVSAHCRADVLRTLHLARRIGVVPVQQLAEVF